MVAVMLPSLASQLLQDLRGMLGLWHDAPLWVRLAGDAMVVMMLPSLASQLLQVFGCLRIVGQYTNL